MATLSQGVQNTKKPTLGKFAARLPRRLVLAVLGAILLIVSFWSLKSGAVDTDIQDVLIAFSGSDSSAAAEFKSIVIREIRLPRLLTGFLIGVALSLSGALLQGLFRNPLADPALIGVSSGGAMGAVIAIVALPALVATLALPEPLGSAISWFGLPVLAMAGAIGLTFIIYQVSLVRGRTHVPAMLLTGIAVNAIGSAFVGLIVTIFASDEQLRTITFWTLGSLSGANWNNTLLLAALILIPAAFALRQDRALNAFLLGETEAFHLGIKVQRVKRAVIIVSAVMVGATVAFCGIIGFIGLVVPHIIRIALGPDHRMLIPAGGLLGAITLIVADVFARSLLAPAELQIGILTAIIGGPFFLALLIGARRGRANSLGV
ncbi:MAG: iron ABC transporter permease [Verrucomicrobiota bacterium]